MEVKEMEVEVNITFSTYTNRAEEIRWILLKCVPKIREHLYRPPCVCTAPEEADKIRDINGNPIGTIQVTVLKEVCCGNAES